MDVDEDTGETRWNLLVPSNTGNRPFKTHSRLRQLNRFSVDTLGEPSENTARFLLELFPGRELSSCEVLHRVLPCGQLRNRSIEGLMRFTATELISILINLL